LVVLALIFVISFVVKKYMGTMENALGTKKQLKVLSNHFIGVKKNVTIIEVGGEILVLGVSNSNVNLLAHYTDPDKIELIRLAHRLPDKPMGLFKRFGFLEGIGKKKVAQPVNSQFARQAASYADNMKRTLEDRAEEMEDKPVSRAATVASTISAARALKARLRSLEGTA
jgi:flagellar biosynthetic protein FliO